MFSKSVENAKTCFLTTSKRSRGESCLNIVSEVISEKKLKVSFQGDKNIQKCLAAKPLQVTSLPFPSYCDMEKQAIFYESFIHLAKMPLIQSFFDCKLYLVKTELTFQLYQEWKLQNRVAIRLESRNNEFILRSWKMRARLCRKTAHCFHN